MFDNVAKKVQLITLNTIFEVLFSLSQIINFETMKDDFKFEKTMQLNFNCPLLPFIDCCKKKKDCCKEFKKGDRCKKCPGKKH